MYTACAQVRPALFLALPTAMPIVSDVATGTAASMLAHGAVELVRILPIFSPRLSPPQQRYLEWLQGYWLESIPVGDKTSYSIGHLYIDGNGGLAYDGENFGTQGELNYSWRSTRVRLGGRDLRYSYDVWDRRETGRYRRGKGILTVVGDTCQAHDIHSGRFIDCLGPHCTGRREWHHHKMLRVDNESGRLGLKLTSHTTEDHARFLKVYIEFKKKLDTYIRSGRTRE